MATSGLNVLDPANAQG
jgi:hypothetical protein